MLTVLRLLCAPFLMIVTVVANSGQTEDFGFFEERIRPVLIAECIECHGADRQRGGLRLDSRDGLRAGGDSGPAIIPGDALNSRLMKAIQHDSSETPMPKDRPRLDPRTIQDIERWIESGAPDPRDAPDTSTEDPSSSSDANAAWEARAAWWSFQPIQSPSLPAVASEGNLIPQHPIDRFINHRLALEGFPHAEHADRATLLRRLTFALTGLPPTDAEIAAFVHDTEESAYERCVDRLLASPHFGERWARHWMDLFRYADSHGSEGDPEIPDAWRYRDYLVRAFNDDIPVDQIVREHIAGDLLPHPRLNPTEQLNESILGTAQLRFVEHGYQPVDTLDEQVRTIDNQIDVLSKAFLGLTVSCARCHDHKFDPIRQADYFGLYGIFASCRPARVTVDTPSHLKLNLSALAETKARVKQALAKDWEASLQRFATGLRHLAEARNSETPIDVQKAEPLPGDTLLDAIGKLEAERGQLEKLAWKSWFNSHASNKASNDSEILKVPPRPLAAWDFDEDTRDAIGNLEGKLLEGATVQGGRLHLPGNGAHMVTGPIPHSLRTRTLEAWVYLASLDQRGGGVLTVEKPDGSVFDSIVFGERQTRRWLAGSEFHRRSHDTDAALESAAPEELVHIVITYSSDGRIALYRNGKPYGDSYELSGSAPSPIEFTSGTSRVLIGKRHTGGGSASFTGSVDKAALYDRALSAREIAALYLIGPNTQPPLSLIDQLPDALRQSHTELGLATASLRAELDRAFPDHSRRASDRTSFWAPLEAAKGDPAHPWHNWVAELLTTDGKSSAVTVAATPTNENSPPPPTDPLSDSPSHRLAWDLSTSDAQTWFLHGVHPPTVSTDPGEFSIEPEGGILLHGLLPPGIISDPLSRRQNGVLTSPTFKIESDYISILCHGGGSARVRIIVDQYPLGAGNLFPQSTLTSSQPRWVRIDTAYRKGSLAYIEVAPADDVTARDRGTTADGRSHYAIQQVVFHDDPATPPWTNPVLTIHKQDSRMTFAAWTEQIIVRMTSALDAWKAGTTSSEDAQWIQELMRNGWLPTRLDALSNAQPEVAEYRKIEKETPVARRAPGVWEAQGINAALHIRGNPAQPGPVVPRRSPEIFGGEPYGTEQSGRLQLAYDWTNETNPLTARVLANRVWGHLFGRALVATPDNFGRLGSAPSHPELLDYLAHHWASNWSLKKLIRWMVTSDTYQRASDPLAELEEKDPENIWLSTMSMRRLDAEAIRDSLLMLARRMDPQLYGPGVRSDPKGEGNQRRSIYLSIRRNSLDPFLTVFDAPKPFTTLGQRDATNIPAQSLALLNDPFVRTMAAAWADHVLAETREQDATGRIDLMFREAFSRSPHPRETERCIEHLRELSQLTDPPTDSLDSPAIWRELALSLINLKEFIHVR